MDISDRDNPSIKGFVDLKSIKSKLEYYAQFIPEDERADFFAELVNIDQIVLGSKILAEGNLHSAYIDPTGHQEPIFIHPQIAEIIRLGAGLDSFLKSKAKGSSKLYNWNVQVIPFDEESCSDEYEVG